MKRKYYHNSLSALVCTLFILAAVFCLAHPAYSQGLSAGSAHSVVLVNGTVWTSGGNKYGQLGDGTTVDRLSPVEVDLTGVNSVSAGGLSTAALKTDGTVWTWGHNGWGQLGDGSESNRSAPVQVKVSSSENLTDVVSVAAGYHMAALKSDGTVWTWGRNNYGQLGDGSQMDSSYAQQVDGLSSVVAVEVGALHTVALKSNGTVWAWGSNAEGELGDNKSSGSLSNTPVQVSGLTNVEAIYAGNYHTFALKSDGALKAWGYNAFGQLGDGTTTNGLVPVSVDLTNVVEIAAGLYYTAALKSDGTVWAWGDNSYGQLTDDELSYSDEPVQVEGLSGISSIAAGDIHALALTSGNDVYAWGNNSSGQFGTGEVPNSKFSVQVSGLTSIDTVTAGSAHTMSLKSDGTIRSWGQNSYGQLGDGSKYPYSCTPVTVTSISNAVSVSSGALYSIAIEYSGYAVSSWGSNYKGQLGDGTTTDRNSPVSTGVTNAVSVAGGFYHTMAVESSGDAWAWGDNSYGQLGYDPASVSGSTTPVEVPVIGSVVTAVAGAYHVVALDTNGDVWTWGRNNKGQLGDGSTQDRYTPTKLTGISDVDAIAAGVVHTVALDGNGDVWVWGGNDLGQLGDGSTQDRSSPYKLTGISGVDAVAAGGYHTLALKSDGTVRSWGYNANGQLGDGSTSNRTTPVQVIVSNPSNYLTDVYDIAAGYSHSAALKDDGTVWTWGNNASCQLGVINYPLEAKLTLF